MREITPQRISEVVARLCMEANYRLPLDVRERIAFCRKQEKWTVAQDTMDLIIENYNLASEVNLPLCQDTGMACVFLEIGQEVHITGDIYDAVSEGVRDGYGRGYLRHSVVVDPLFERRNSGDNTPAMITIDLVPGDRLTVTVAPKGFGSENMSRIKMLQPADGVRGVKDFVLETVETAGPNPCPPLVIGVGIGGTFDKVALLAKKALLRPLGSANSDPRYASLEQELLQSVNASGIGPQGFGGLTTALSVAIEQYPTHIAGLPCAVNLNCHVARHAREVI